MELAWLLQGMELDSFETKLSRGGFCPHPSALMSQLLQLLFGIVSASISHIPSSDKGSRNQSFHSTCCLVGSATDLVPFPCPVAEDP